MSLRELARYACSIGLRLACDDSEEPPLVPGASKASLQLQLQQHYAVGWRPAGTSPALRDAPPSLESGSFTQLKPDGAKFLSLGEVAEIAQGSFEAASQVKHISRGCLSITRRSAQVVVVTCQHKNGARAKLITAASGDSADPSKLALGEELVVQAGTHAVIWLGAKRSSSCSEEGAALQLTQRGERVLAFELSLSSRKLKNMSHSVFFQYTARPSIGMSGLVILRSARNSVTASLQSSKEL